SRAQVNRVFVSTMFRVRAVRPSQTLLPTRELSLDRCPESCAVLSRCIGLMIGLDSIQRDLRSANQIATRVDGFVERSVVRAILQELNHFVDLFFKHKLATAFPLELRGGTQENQNRQRKLAFAQVSP